TRAMSRRVSRIFRALSSWPIDFWKRSLKSCSLSSRSLAPSSSALISRTLSAFIWISGPRYGSSSNSGSPGMNPASPERKPPLRASRRHLRLEPLHEARLDGELVRGQAQRLARVLLRHPFHLVEDAAGLHHHDP